jgi:hypothetical protein
MRLFMLLFAAVILLGCGRAESPKAQAPVHDPDDVPITEADVKMPASYAEAVPQIKSYRDTIRSSIEAGTPSKAHRSLDEVDLVLNKLPSIAKASGVPKERWEAVNTSAQELRNLFNQVHSAIDAKREPDYKAVAEPIDKAIEKLEQVTP